MTRLWTWTRFFAVAALLLWLNLVEAMAISKSTCLPSRVRHAQARKHSNLSVRVQWESAKIQCTTDKIFRYWIFGRVDDGTGVNRPDDTMTAIVSVPSAPSSIRAEPVTLMSYTFTNLTENIAYQFAVQAESMNGKGSLSQFTPSISFGSLLPNMTDSMSQQRRLNLHGNAFLASKHTNDLKETDTFFSSSQDYSFATGYGSSFVCTDVCHLNSNLFIVLILFVLTLILVIPIQKPRYMKLEGEIIKGLHPKFYTRETGDGVVNVATPTKQLGAKIDEKTVHQSDGAKIRLAIDQEQQEEAKLDVRLTKDQFSSELPEPLKDQDNSGTKLKKPIIVPPEYYEHKLAVPTPRKAKVLSNYEDLGSDQVREHERLNFLLGVTKGFHVHRLTLSSAKPIKCSLFMTEDLKTVFWSKGRKSISKSSSFKVDEITSVSKGMESPTLKERGIATDAHLYLTIVTKKLTLDLQAPDEMMLRRLYFGFSALLEDQDKPDIESSKPSTEHVKPVNQGPGTKQDESQDTKAAENSAS